MSVKLRFQPLAKTGLTVILGSSLVSALLYPVDAKPLAVTDNSSSQLLSQSFQPPDRGAPPRTTDGGSRGCGLVKSDQKALTALTPANSLALTVSEYPTFFWYVPATSAKSIEFSLMDESDSTVLYTTNIKPPSQGGIIRFTLPATSAPKLEVGKMYHWYVAMVCNSNDRSGDTYVDGWIERTQKSPSLEAKLKNANNLAQQAEVYAANGIWHEALAISTQRRLQESGSSKGLEDWKLLLKSADLSQFINEPLLETTLLSQE